MNDTIDPYKTIQAARDEIDADPIGISAGTLIKRVYELCKVAQQALEECERLKARLREAEEHTTKLEGLHNATYRHF
jgi:hypothetical protein